MTPDRTLLGYLAAASALTIYAGMFTVGRAGAAAGLDGYDQTALRFLVSTVLILPFGIAGLRTLITQTGLFRCIALALLNGATYSAIFLGGLTFAPVAYGAAIVPGLQPFVVMLLGLAFLGTMPRRPVLVGNLVCLGGVSCALQRVRAGWAARRHSAARPAGPGSCHDRHIARRCGLPRTREGARPVGCGQA